MLHNISKKLNIKQHIYTYLNTAEYIFPHTLYCITYRKDINNLFMYTSSSFYKYKFSSEVYAKAFTAVFIILVKPHEEPKIHKDIQGKHY